MKIPETQAELQDLLSRVCDQQATEQELLWLNKTMMIDPRVRYLYWEYLAAEVEIQSWISGADESRNSQAFVPVDFERVLAAPVVRSSLEESHGVSGRIRVLDWRRHPVRFAVTLAAMAATVSGIGLGLFWNRLNDNALQTVGVERRSRVATVIQNINAEWADPALSVEEGSVLMQHQVLQIASGFSVVEFASGARVVLRGPSTFVVTGKNQGSLQVGELTARVTADSQGFRVLTPHATIVDLGTQFGVHVDLEGMGAVQVFEGSVDLYPDQATKPVRLMWGTALSLNGTTDIPPSARQEFVREQLLPIREQGREQEAPGIRADVNGVIQLLAKDAEITGQALRTDVDLEFLGAWHDRDDFPSWEIFVDEDRQFQIELELACSGVDAGGSYVANVDGVAVGEIRIVPDTGGYRRFQQVNYGTVKLRKGQHTISVVSRKERNVIASESKEDAGGLMNLRSVTLAPIQ